MKKELCLILVLSIAAALLPAQASIVIASPGFDHPMAIVMKRILTKAYKAIGCDPSFVVLPPTRQGVSFDLGSVDAVIFSDDAFRGQHPGAIRVEPDIGSDGIVVFAKRKDIAAADWSDLERYTVGYQIGMAIVENKMKAFKSVNPAQNPPQAFSMLEAGRSDVVVMPLGVGLMTIKQLGLKDLRCLGTELEKVKLYHFLAAKRSGLAQPLGAALARIKKSGELKKVTDEVYAGFMK